jgi:hypothetical protein
MCEWDWVNDIAAEVYDITKEEEFNKKVENGIIRTDDNVVEFAFIGPKDMGLAQTLITSGPEHRKFLRQIFVSVDITAPLYWWKEADTYKVGTVANSTSTMHKITSKPITIDCFEIDDYKQPRTWECGQKWEFGVESNLIPFLEELRLKYLEIAEMLKNPNIDDETRKGLMVAQKEYWKELIRWLPESWLQTRTITMNYENLLAICSKSQRRFHKLTEWSGDGEDFTTPSFIKFARSLPYAQEFIFIDELQNK